MTGEGGTTGGEEEAVETQLGIEDPGDARTQGKGTCAWCALPAARKLEVEKARYRTDHNGDKVLARSPIIAPACRGHYDRFEEQKARAAEARDKAKRR